MYLQCKVLIIGGGPAGAIAARELSRKGIDHILLEKDLFFLKPCGGGLKLSAFKEFDLPYHLIEKLVHKIEIISPRLRKASVDITQAPLAIVDRKEFDSALRHMAQKEGTQIIEAKVYDITIGKKIRALAKSQEENIEIEADYIIAADGVHSMVRRKVCNEIPNRILTKYMDIEQKNTETCQFWFGQDIAPGHYAWVFPRHKGSNIGTISCSEKYLGEYIQNMLIKTGFEVEKKVRGYYIPDWGKEIFYEKNVFFVGDSASLVLPFTYEGIYYAMQSAVLAVSAIDAGNPNLYKQKWQRLNEKRFKFLHLVQRIFLSSDFMSERLVALYQHSYFQKAVIGYWMGTKKPLGTFMTLWKVVKLLILGGWLSFYQRQFSSQNYKNTSSDTIQPDCSSRRMRKPYPNSTSKETHHSKYNKSRKNKESA